jgi:thioredoxin 1
MRSQASPGNFSAGTTKTSGDRIQTVTAATFGSLVLEAQGPIAVEFMSYGCAYCRELEPVLQQVAGMLQSQGKICRVNVAVEERLAATYDVQGTPTLVMFINGREVGRAEGLDPSVDGIMAVMRQAFGS